MIKMKLDFCHTKSHEYERTIYDWFTHFAHRNLTNANKHSPTLPGDIFFILLQKCGCFLLAALLPLKSLL